MRAAPLLPRGMLLDHAKRESADQEEGLRSSPYVFCGMVSLLKSLRRDPRTPYKDSNIMSNPCDLFLLGLQKGMGTDYSRQLHARIL